MRHAVWALAACTPSASGGRDQGQEVSGELGFTRERTPCVSTLHQVFSRLDREAFELLLGQWLKERGLEAGEPLAIDGKEIAGGFTESNCLGSTWWRPTLTGRA